MGSKISKYFDYISAGLLTLISFFCLAFPLIKAVDSVGSSGFSFISFVNTSDWLAIVSGVMCVLQLGVCVFMAIYFVLILCKGENERDKKIFFIFNIILLCFLFIYMLLGVLWIALNRNFFGYTLAYIPLLLGVFVFIFYFLQKKINGETVQKAPAKKVETKPAEAKPAEAKPAEAKPAAKSK